MDQKRFRTSIIDLGCDVGFLGKNLTSRGKKFTLHGADINQQRLALARKYYHKVYNFNLNTSPWPLRKKYEIAVLADTLEHLDNPGKVLNQTLDVLRSGGIMILSVPNSVFWWARLKLLLGQFPQDDRGIFDRTHRHFYTLATVKDLLQKNKRFFIEDIQFTTIPLQFIFKNWTFGVSFLYTICHWLAQQWPNMFAYQIIIIATKKNH